MKAAKAALFSLVLFMGATVTADAFAQRHGGRHHGAHGGHHHGGHHHGGHRYHGGRYWGGFGFGLALGSAVGYGYGYYPRAYYSPYYSPYWYSPYAYDSAPVVSAAPPVYVEQSQADAPAAEPRQGRQGRQGSWYFCRDSNAYYPYVQQCATEWERVAPRPQT